MTVTTSQEGKPKCPVKNTSMAAGLTGSKDSLSEEVNVHLQWLTEAEAADSQKPNRNILYDSGGGTSRK